MIAGLFRLLQLVLMIFTSDFFWYLLKYKIFGINYKKSFGNAVASLLYKMGPVFVKAGQILSTRPDLIGKDNAEYLSALQDNLPAFDFKYVKKIFLAEFKQDIDDIFSEFERDAVATASVAQVHKAITKQGQVVAVKILRPNIEKLFTRDINFFKLVTKILALHTNYRWQLKEIISLLQTTIRQEINLKMEAASAQQLSINIKEDRNIYVPEIFWHLTSKKILTMEWVDGTHIYDIEKLQQQEFDMQLLSKTLAITFFNQVYRDGFFHADLHQGNVLVDSKGRIVLIDFGIMGILTQEDRITLAKILHGFVNHDYRTVAEVHLEAGFIPQDACIESFALACRGIGEPIIGKSVKQLSIGKLLENLFDVTKEFNMKSQPKLLLLQKTMVTVEGIGFMIYPDINMWQLAEPWINNWYKNYFTKSKLIEKKIKKSVILPLQKLIKMLKTEIVR